MQSKILTEIDVNLVKKMTFDMLKQQGIVEGGKGQEEVERIVDRVLKNTTNTYHGFDYAMADYVQNKIVQVNLEKKLKADIDRILNVLNNTKKD